MANLNSPFGMRPVGSLLGAPLSGMMNTYAAPAAYATDLFVGDPVVVTGARSSPGVGFPAYQVVARATAGATNQITGVIVGFQPTPLIIASGYGVLSTDRYPIVCDDPAAIFEMQEDAVGNTIAAATIGLNANLVAGTGNAYTKKSGFMIDSDTAAADATFQLTLRDFAEHAGLDNEEAVAYSKILVTINLHTKRLGAVAGI